MKKCLVMGVCALIIIAGCEPQAVRDGGIPRIRTQGGSGAGDKTHDADSSLAGSPGVYVAAISVRDSYNWQIDTALGAAACDAVLYLDGRKILSFPTGYEYGVGTDPDSYHLFGGHLYTNFTDGMGTVIKKDGVQLFRYAEREQIKGLLVKDDDVYTLGCGKVTGEGFSLRRNGQLILATNGGQILGGFDALGAERTGALYEDCGQVCFNYKDVLDNVVYVVEDGSLDPISVIANSRILSVRRFCGENFCIYTTGATTSFQSPSYFQKFGSYTALEEAQLGEVGHRLMFYYWWGAEFRLYDSKCVPLVHLKASSPAVYGDDITWKVISREPSGSLSAYNESGVEEWRLEPSFFLSRDCATMSEGALYVAATPNGSHLGPVLYKNGTEVSDFGIDGFATAVEVVSPPN